MRHAFKTRDENTNTQKRESYIIRAPRYLLNLDMIIQEVSWLFSKGRALNAQSCDMSLSGVKIISPYQINVGKKLRITILPSPGIRNSRKLSLYAKVARVHKKNISNAAAFFEIGIQFASLSKRQIPLLESWFESGRYIG